MNGESMGSILANAAELIKGEGFTGAHSFIFLTRYASLCGDKALMSLIGNSLSALSTLPESASLAYAYAEYYQATEADFCPAAVDFLLGRCREDDPMLLPATAKCARVFSSEDWFERAILMARDALSEEIPMKTLPFVALGLIELYRATFNREYLKRAMDLGDEIRKKFADSFDPETAYDLENPGANSAVALLYDELARLTQNKGWLDLRKIQNHFISLLADKYPTRVAFGLCALLGDEFEWKTVICSLPGMQITKEVRALLGFYSPLTEVVAVPSEGEEAQYFIMKNGTLKEIKGI